ncbi:NmrA family transcriptional regulator [Leptodontidium sp. MPI-SDFR-AT-0119]|nr:NmrA family transcriptional regulator [Leptodontidium sp. MPI-SDFR-AT-0119]
MAKIFTIFGATGAQGGSIARFILDHPVLSKTYSVRAVTRDASKPAAIVLRERGVELVEADLDNVASVQTAVAGSYGVFAVTDFWVKAIGEVEVTQGKAVADAAVAAGASLLIWSSLPNATRISHGELSKSHFNFKAEVEEYIRTLPIMSSFYIPGYYMQNMRHSLAKWTKQEDGSQLIQKPWTSTTRIPLVDIRDTGKYLAPILLNPEKYDGKRFISATGFYTPNQVIDIMMEVTGEKLSWIQLSLKDFASSLPAHFRDELTESARMLCEYDYYGPTGEKDLQWTLNQMDGTPTSFEKCLVEQGPWFEAKG